MTPRKLKRMLKRVPALLVIELLVFAAMLIMSFGAISMSRSEGMVAVALGVFVQLLIVYVMVKLCVRAHRLKKNGKKTIRYLEENGLLEAAAAEYSHPGKTTFRVATRDYAPDKFPYRDNTLTENFIFALSSNRIIRYQDVYSTYLILYMVSDEYANEVFVLRTHEGEEVDLLSYQIRNSVTPPKQLIEWICAIIKAKNPQCNVSKEVVSARKR